jgi:hypothetical protein
MPSCISIAGFEEVSQIPVSTFSSPASLDYGGLVRMRDPGEDIFTATPEIFDRARGGVDSLHQWISIGAPDWAVNFTGGNNPERSSLMEDGEPVCRDQW